MGAAMKDFREFALRQVLKNKSLLSREEGGGEDTNVQPIAEDG